MYTCQSELNNILCILHNLTYQLDISLKNQNSIKYVSNNHICIPQGNIE